MVKHIVLFKLKDEAPADKKLTAMKEFKAGNPHYKIACGYYHGAARWRCGDRRVKDEVEQATGLKVARVIVSVDDVIA